MHVYTKIDDKECISARDRAHEYADGFIEFGNNQYTRPEALAKLLGISLRTLSRWEKFRVGPPRIKIGHVRLYDLSQLSEWLKQHERQPLEARGTKR